VVALAFKELEKNVGIRRYSIEVSKEIREAGNLQLA